jgi:hypothetical protein
MRQPPPGWPKVFSRPSDAVAARLLGSTHKDGVHFTTDQLKALYRVYNFDPDQAREIVEECRKMHDQREEVRRRKHEKERSLSPFKPIPFVERGLLRFYSTGADLGVLRMARMDGLRVMALLSKFLEEGEDPVRFVETLLSDAGFDCMIDEWGDEDED